MDRRARRHKLSRDDLLGQHARNVRIPLPSLIPFIFFLFLRPVSFLMGLNTEPVPGFDWLPPALLHPDRIAYIGTYFLLKRCV